MSEQESPGAKDAAASRTRLRPPTRFWFGGLCVLAVVLAGLLVPMPFSGREANWLGDLCHAPLFGMLSFGVLQFWSRHASVGDVCLQAAGRRILFRGLFVWAALTTFGFATEWLQDQFGRTGTLHDAVANLIGAAAGVALHAGVELRRLAFPKLGGVTTAMAVVLFVAAWVRPIYYLRDVVAMPMQFPLLASFEIEPELTRWQFEDVDAKRVSADATDGRYSLQAHFKRDDFASITLIEMVKDWAEMKSIQCDLVLDESCGAELLELQIQIIDEALVHQWHASFIQTIRLPRGVPTRVRIPLSELVDRNGRQIDVTKIHAVSLGTHMAPDRAIVRVDRLILEP